MEAEASVEPAGKRERYSHYAHSAIFAEVQVDVDFGTVRVIRVVSAVAGGRSRRNGGGDRQCRLSRHGPACPGSSHHPR